MIYFVLFVVGFFLLLLFFRALGSWLFRIDDVIKELQEIKKALK